LRNVENDLSLCMDFFTEAVSRFEEDDSIEPLFTKAMVDISNKLSTLSMNDDYKVYVNVSPPLSNLHPGWPRLRVLTV
jgi:ubiquitin conjugation factor E4 B